MKNTVKRILSIVLVVALFATLGVTAFAAVTPSSKSILVGGTVTATCQENESHVVKFTTSDTSGAISISSDGKTVTGVKKGAVSVTMKCETCASNSATDTIEVKCCDVAECACAAGCAGDGYCNCTACKKPTAIAIAEGNTVNVIKGATTTLTATPTYHECCASSAAMPVSDYTWAVTNGADKIDELQTTKGKSITVKGKEYGTAVISVTINGETKSVTVNITPAAPSGSDKTVNVIASGTKYTLDPGVTAAAGGTLSYKWSQTKGGSDLGTTSTLQIDINEATTTSRVYYCDVVETKDGQASAAKTIKFTVNVKDQYEVKVTPTLSADVESITVGEGLRLKATVYKNAVSSNAFTQTVVNNPVIAWSTADANSITIENTTNAINTVTGKAPNTTGVDVVAKFTDTVPNPDVEYSGKYSIKVQDSIAVSFQNASATGSVLVGYTTDAAKVYSVYNNTQGKIVNATAVSGNPYTYTVEYSSGNTAIATVDASTGVVRGVALGTTDITAKVTVKKDTAVVAVVEKKCRISVVSDDYDICVNIKVGSTITFKDANFADWYAKKVGSTYTMNHVVLGAPSNALGTFKHSGIAITPYETAFAVAGRTSTYYIANTSYTAGSTPYYVTVPFTCYGGTTSTSVDVAVSGTLYIFVNNGTVGNITYDVSDTLPEKLLESHFLSVFTTATGSTSAYDSFEIELLDVPEMGDLYVNYVSSANPGTKITSSNYKATSFVADDALTSVGTNIESLTYVPGLRAAGEEVIRYAVYKNGTLCYVARVIFDNGDSDYVGYAEGYTFKSSDFYSASVADPVVSVKFSQPTTGKIYSSYANGSGTLAASTDTFYTYTAVSGQKPITSAVLIPPAGFSGDISVKVTSTTRLGVTKEETLVITFKSKTASSYFTDVTAKNTGTWSANAIDYAYKWGLVNGTTTTAPLKFGPGGNMTRAQFVAVIYRAAGSPSVAGITNPFTDVKNTTSTSWYYNAVLWAYTNKIVTGATATTFNPNGKLTREQLAKMLYGFDQVIKKTTPTGATTIYDYTDYTKVSSYAVDSIKWAVGNGIITSASATAKTINPQGSATRAQVATMLHRYLTK